MRTRSIFVNMFILFEINTTLALGSERVEDNLAFRKNTCTQRMTCLGFIFLSFFFNIKCCNFVGVEEK